MSMNKIFISTGLALIMMIFFQNCQRAKMAAKGDSDLGSLQVVNGDDFQPPPTDPPPTDPPPTDPPPSDPPPTDPDPVCPTDNGDMRSDDDSHSHDHSKHGHYKSKDGNHEMCDDESSDDHSADDCKDHHGKEEGARTYICGISGPGKSDRIGVTENEQLVAEHDSHQGKKLVCMTKYACETISKKAFTEAHTIRYGWCKDGSNKNVKHISDENMRLLIDKYIQDNAATGPKN